MGLIPDRVEAPDFADVDLVFVREPARDIYRAKRHIQVEGGPRPAQVGPLGTRLQVIDRFGRFHFNGAQELARAVRGSQHEVGENLQLTDFDRRGLVLADVGNNLVLSLQFDLEEPDDAIVFELFANGTHENRAHLTSGRVQHRTETCREAANYRQVSGKLYSGCYLRSGDVCYPVLDVDVFSHENDAVISSLENHPAESATRTILIVDDDRSVADTFARILKLEGFEVATAMSAEAGMEIADSVAPDAIILDMRMPITNGLQFLRLIRTKPHLVEVPVAIVTGDYFLADAIQNELRSLGASIRFKPMYLEDLLTLARTMVS